MQGIDGGREGDQGKIHGGAGRRRAHWMLMLLHTVCLYTYNIDALDKYTEHKQSYITTPANTQK